MGEEIGQGHPNDNIVEDHQEHAPCGLAHAVEGAEAAVCDCVQNVPDADDEEIGPNNCRHPIALDEQAGELFGEPDY